MIGLFGIIMAVLVGALFGLSAFGGAELYKMVIHPWLTGGRGDNTTAKHSNDNKKGGAAPSPAVVALEDRLARKRRRFPTISKLNTIPTDAANFDGSSVQATKSVGGGGDNNNINMSVSEGMSCTALFVPHASPALLEGGAASVSNDGGASAVDVVMDVDAEEAVVLRMLLVGRTLSLYTVDEEAEYARREALAQRDMRWLAGKVAATEASDVRRAAAEAFAASPTAEEGGNGRSSNNGDAKAPRKTKRLRHMLASDVLLGKITLGPSVAVTLHEDRGAHMVRISTSSGSGGDEAAGIAASIPIASRHAARPAKVGLFDPVPRPATDAADAPATTTPLAPPQWHNAVITFETYREACRWYTHLFEAALAGGASNNGMTCASPPPNAWSDALRAAAVGQAQTTTSASSAACHQPNPLMDVLATRMVSSTIAKDGISAPITDALRRSYTSCARRLQDVPIASSAASHSHSADGRGHGGTFAVYHVAKEDLILPITTSAKVTIPRPNGHINAMGGFGTSGEDQPFTLGDQASSDAASSHATASSCATSAVSNSSAAAAAAADAIVLGRVGASLKLMEMRAGQTNAAGHTTLAAKHHLGDLSAPCEKPYDDVSDDDDDGAEPNGSASAGHGQRGSANAAQPPLVLYDVAAAGSSTYSPATAEVSFDATLSTANSRNPFVEALFQIFIHSEPVVTRHASHSDGDDDALMAAAHAVHDDELDEAANLLPPATSTNSDKVRILPPLYVYVKVECVDGRLCANVAPPPTAAALSGKGAMTATPELWFGFYGRPAATVTADIINPTTFRSFYEESIGLDAEGIRTAIKAAAAMQPFEDAISTAVAEGVFAALFAEVTLPHYGAMPMPTMSTAAPTGASSASSPAVVAALEGGMGAAVEAFMTARLELHEAQCAVSYAEAVNANAAPQALPSPCMPNSSGSQHPFASPLPAGSVARSNHSVVVPWLQSQQQQDGVELPHHHSRVAAADVASALSKWSFPASASNKAAPLDPTALVSTQSNSGATARATTPLRRLYQRGPSPLQHGEQSDALAMMGSRQGSAYRGVERFDLAGGGGGSTAHTPSLMPLSIPPMHPTPRQAYPPQSPSSPAGDDAGSATGSVALEVSGFRRREEQLRTALAEARAQAAREQARRVADEERNDKRREEEARKAQERLAELEQRMREEKEREARKKIQDDLDRQNEEERARRKLVESQLEAERTQRTAMEGMTASRIANTERAITMLSETIQKLAERPLQRSSSRRSRRVSPSSSDSHSAAERGPSRASRSMRRTPMRGHTPSQSVTSPTAATPMADERVAQLQAQMEADRALLERRKEEEAKAQQAMASTISELQARLAQEIELNRQRVEEDRRQKEREDALAGQIGTMQAKQRELQEAIDGANALGEQVRDREAQLRQTEETLDLLRTHLMQERNDQASMAEQRLAEEEARKQREAALKAELALRAKEDADRLEATQRELKAIREKAEAAEAEAEERRRADERDKLKAKDKQKKAQARLKEAEEAIVSLQAQIMSSTPRTPATSDYEGGRMSRSASAGPSKRHSSRVRLGGRDSPSISSRAHEGNPHGTPRNTTVVPPIAIGGTTPPPPKPHAAATDDEDGAAAAKAAVSDCDSDFEYRSKEYASPNNNNNGADGGSGGIPPALAALPSGGAFGDDDDDAPSTAAMQQFLAQSFGAVISPSLEVEGSASGKGVEAEDMLLEVNGSSLHSLRQLYDAFKELPAGEVVIISVLRGGNIDTITVTVKSE